MNERSNSQIMQHAGKTTPWTLESLEGLSRQQVELSNQLLELLPRASLEDSAFVHLSDWLHELTSRRYQFELYRLGVHESGTIPTNFGDSFSTWFELPPDLVRGAIIIDQQIVEDLVSGLLEQPTTSNSFNFSKKSNPYHWGLVLYVLSRMVDRLSKLGLPPLLMGTDQLEIDDLRIFLEVENKHLIEVVFVVFNANHRGLIRLLLPGELIQILETYAQSAPGRRESREFVVYGPFADLPLNLPLELGRTALTSAEIRDLERGDVIFLAQHGLQIDGLNGGSGEHGRLHLSSDKFLPCELFEGDDGYWNARVRSDAIQQQNGADQEGSMSDQELSDERTSYLAGGAAVTVEVRVGKVTLSVAELTRLQSGHVMVLDRDVSRGVELVADGRIIGSGELVNVEGTLGVRVQWMGVRS